jgi:hypothetical protein
VKTEYPAHFEAIELERGAVELCTTPDCCWHRGGAPWGAKELRLEVTPDGVHWVAALGWCDDGPDVRFNLARVTSWRARVDPTKE